MNSVLNLTLGLGETWLQTFTYPDGANVASANWRLSTRRGALVLEVPILVGQNALDVSVTPQMQSDAGVTVSTYRHELRLTLNSGAVDTIVTGSLDVEASLFDLPEPGEGPTPIIFDQDFCADVEDVASLAVISSFVGQGLCKVIAAVTDSSDPYAAPAMDAVFRYSGLTSVPIGAFKGNTNPAVGPFTAGVVADFLGSNITRATYPDALVILRTALNDADDGKVVYYSGGFLDNLAALLQSSGDTISPLTGLQLVAQKVKRVVIMGGNYPSGAEYNIIQSPPSAAYVAANCPVPMLWNGADIGGTIMAGPSTGLPYTNAYGRAYALFGTDKRPSWDTINSIIAVLGVTNQFNTPGVNGTNTINSTTGANAWTPTPGLSSYIGKAATDVEIAATVQAYIDGAPNINPGTTPGWIKSGSIVDCDFVNSRYYGGFLETLFSCTRAASGPDLLARAVDSSGNFYTFAANVLRRTPAGLLIENAATNVVLWNRDLTNAAWTKSNVTAALTQPGADGASNAATSLTATATNGTCLQPITLASSIRVQSAWVKRLVGSGTIEMTTDGGTSWFPLTITTSWARYTLSVQTLANPSVGFRIGTSGDAIAVDFVQNETSIGGKASSPILTNGSAVTRALDTIAPIGPLNSNIRQPQGTLFMQTNLLNMSGFAIMLGIGTGSVQYFGTGGSTTQIRNYVSGAAINATPGGGASLNGGRVKMGTAFDASGRSLVANNGTLVSSTGFYLADQFLVMMTNGYLERFTLFPTKLADSALSALTV